MKKEKGFTIIELLVSLSVLAILSAGIIVGYNSVSQSSQLKTNTFKVLDVLNLARTRTLASLATSSYGVHFETSQYVLFKGTTYSAMDSNNIFYVLPTVLQITNINLSGAGVDVVFDRLTGKTSQSGSLVVELIADPTKFKTITILSSGRSDIIESVQTPLGTRITDTRHVHFTYGASIESTVNLVLNFPGYFSQNISFPSYYTGGSTGSFSWAGTISVGGTDQILEIHTHANTGSSADFSITRDLRYNNKALQISLDAQNLVNYAVDGTVSQGASLWVSAPQIQ